MVLGATCHQRAEVDTAWSRFPQYHTAWSLALPPGFMGVEAEELVF
jgi:hypothetical protein